jgi:hypothetical protein
MDGPFGAPYHKLWRFPLKESEAPRAISMIRFPLCALMVLNVLSVPLPAEDRKEEPISPKDGVIGLFNGKDLTGLHTWLKDTKREDPRKAFTVHEGLLHFSGAGFGFVEYKWGKRTDGGKFVRNSGILLHAVGPEGGAKGVWMSSIECQLAQGCVGDIIAIRGKDEKGETIPVRVTSEIVLGPDKKPRWKKGGQPTLFTNRQLWWSRHDPDFKELLDTRGKNDVESPLDEWTRVECVCEGKRIQIIVNGAVVNECYDVFPAAGQILLEAEGFEIFFRKFELQPLTKRDKTR